MGQAKSIAMRAIQVNVLVYTDFFQVIRDERNNIKSRLQPRDGDNIQPEVSLNYGFNRDGYFVFRIMLRREFLRASAKFILR